MGTENQNNGTKIQVEEFKDHFRVTRYADQRLPANTILWPDEVEGVHNFFSKETRLGTRPLA